MNPFTDSDKKSKGKSKKADKRKEAISDSSDEVQKKKIRYIFQVKLSFVVIRRQQDLRRRYSLYYLLLY